MNKMTTTRPGLGFEEGTIGEAALTHMVHDVSEDIRVASKIPKLARTPRLKKDNHVAGPVCMSPKNPQFGKLSMEEKGKVVTIEIDEQE